MTEDMDLETTFMEVYAVKNKNVQRPSGQINIHSMVSEATVPINFAPATQAVGSLTEVSFYEEACQMYFCSLPPAGFIPLFTHLMIIITWLLKPLLFLFPGPING